MPEQRLRGILYAQPLGVLDPQSQLMHYFLMRQLQARPETLRGINGAPFRPGPVRPPIPMPITGHRG